MTPARTTPKTYTRQLFHNPRYTPKGIRPRYWCHVCGRDTRKVITLCGDHECHKCEECGEARTVRTR